MSYDIELYVMSDNVRWTREDSQLNYTYNVSPMYRHVIDENEGINILHGMRCADARGILETSVKRMYEDREELETMNPTNGWGDYEGALMVLEKLLLCCRMYPSARISIT